MAYYLATRARPSAVTVHTVQKACPAVRCSKPARLDSLKSHHAAQLRVLSDGGANVRTYKHSKA
jgi:hypothetical protein